MAVNVVGSKKGHAQLVLAQSTATQTYDITTSTTFPANFVETSSTAFAYTKATGGIGAFTTNPFVLAILVEAGADPAGNYVTATGGSVLSTGVICIVDLSNIAAASDTNQIFGNALNGVGSADSRNAALAKFGAFRIVISAGNSLNAALRVADGGGTGAFHADSDGNTASGTGNLVSRTSGFNGVGGVKCKLTAQSRTAGNWKYSQQITASFTLKSAIDGTSGPYNDTGATVKNVKVAWSTDIGVTTPVKKQSIAISSAGVVSVPATNIDTDWGQANGGTAFYSQLAVGQNFGDATIPSNEKSEMFTLGGATTDAADNEQAAYVFANVSQVSPFVNSTDTNRRLRTSTADQLASAQVVITATAFQETGRTTAKTRWKRKSGVGSTNDNSGANQAHPFMRANAVDAYGTAFSSTSFKTHVVKTATVTPEVDDAASPQTITSGSAGAAGQVDWAYDIGANLTADTIKSPAGNRFKQTTPDAVVTLIAVRNATSGTTTTLTDSVTDFLASGIAIGDIVVVTGGTGVNQRLKVSAVAQHQLTFLFASYIAIDSTSQYRIDKPPYIQRDIFLVGNAFAGTKEPTSNTVSSVYGVNSEIIFAGLTTVIDASTTVDVNGAPTGIGGRSFGTASGLFDFKTCSEINEATGIQVDATRPNPRDSLGNQIDISGSEALFGAKSMWNTTKDQSELAVTEIAGGNVNHALDAVSGATLQLGYSKGSGGDNGFENFNPSGASRNVAIHMAYADLRAQEQTWAMSEDDPHLVDGITRTSAILGFTGDQGNYGAIRTVVNLYTLDPTLRILLSVDNVAAVPGSVITASAKVVRRLADGTILGVAPDGAPFIYLTKVVSNVLGIIAPNPDRMTPIATQAVQATGTATSGTTTTLVDSGAGFIAAGVIVNSVLTITAGTNVGAVLLVTAVTTTQLTFAAQGTAMDATSAYSVTAPTPDWMRVYTGLGNGTYELDSTCTVGGTPLLYDSESEFLVGAFDDNLAIAVGSGNLVSPGRHFTPGDPFTVGAALVKNGQTQPFDAGTSKVALLRFNVATQKLESLQNDNSWSDVQPFNLFVLGVSTGDPNVLLKTFSLAGGFDTSTWNTQDIFVDCIIKQGGVTYRNVQQGETVGSKFKHDATDETSIPFDATNGHSHLGVAEGSVVASRAMGDRS